MTSNSSQQRSLIDENADWRMVPEHIREGVKRYVDHHQLSGDFLTAVFENDLGRAAVRADSVNLVMLGDIAKFMVWYVPPICWGSREAVQDWLNDANSR